MLKGEVALL